jgi:hypothetical protein
METKYRENCERCHGTGIVRGRSFVPYGDTYFLIPVQEECDCYWDILEGVEGDEDLVLESHLQLR